MAFQFNDIEALRGFFAFQLWVIDVVDISPARPAAHRRSNSLLAVARIRNNFSTPNGDNSITRAT